jgi:hypothetical protein
MNIYPNGSVLLQIGISALVIVFLYGLHLFLEGFEKEDRERLMRQRYARRWSDQEWMAMLKSLSDRRFTSQFTVVDDWEDTVPGLDVMQESTLANQAQEICCRMLGESEYSIVGEPAFQHILVGISLGEDTLR